MHISVSLLSSLFLFVENCQFGVPHDFMLHPQQRKTHVSFPAADFRVFHILISFNNHILYSHFAQSFCASSVHCGKIQLQRKSQNYFLFQGHSLAFLCRRYSPVPRRFLCLFPFPGSQMFRSLQKRVISPLSASGSFPHISQIGYLHEFDMVYNFFVCCGDRQTLFG